ncbi:MAG: alpha/beta hydrolase [Candidatus Shapirobacteria bacterium]|nr:alpha/beta hydrolase [Candidatus Shapirobacteria bacterium]
MITKKIEIKNNLRLNVYDSAFEKKYPTDLTVVFIHGAGAGSLLNWEYQLNYFSEKYRTIAYDWRGCGKSDRPKSYTFDEHYQDFLDLMKILKVSDKPILVGHSYGCLIARRYISEHPVGKFVNVSLGLSSIEKGLLKQLLKLPKFLQIPLYRGFYLFRNPFFARRLLASKGTPINLIRQTMKGNKRPPINFFLGLKTFCQDEPLKWIKNYQEKMLIIGGNEDRCFKPGCLEKLKQLIPQASLEIIPNAGHIVPYEAPEYFNQVLENFIERD